MCSHPEPASCVQGVGSSDFIGRSILKHDGLVSGLSICAVTPGELRKAALSAQIEAVYQDVFTRPPYNEAPCTASGFCERLERESVRESWRLLVAEVAGEVCGFAYGYATRPGQWWHDRVALDLPNQVVDEWFSDAFVLVEFAVHSSAQGRSVGSALHKAVLSDLDNSRALTMTLRYDNPAFTFYERFNWRLLVEDFRFHDEDKARAILGLELG